MSNLSFVRDLLPPPSVVLQRLGIVVPGKMNAGGFWLLRCPFHKEGNESNPSLNIHAIEGFYRCHACGAKGRDILAFYMALTRKDFREAIIDLGAGRSA